MDYFTQKSSTFCGFICCASFLKNFLHSVFNMAGLDQLLLDQIKSFFPKSFFWLYTRLFRAQGKSWWRDRVKNVHNYMLLHIIHAYMRTYIHTYIQTRIWKASRPAVANLASVMGETGSRYESWSPRWIRPSDVTRKAATARRLTFTASLPVGPCARVKLGGTCCRSSRETEERGHLFTGPCLSEYEIWDGLKFNLVCESNSVCEKLGSSSCSLMAKKQNKTQKRSVYKFLLSLL